MIIQDLLTSNANQFIAELKNKHANLKQRLVGTEPGGDFRETIVAQISIVQVALNAANAEYNRHIIPPVPSSGKFVFQTRRDVLKPPKSAVTWAEKLVIATRRKGADLTLEELLILAKNHKMTPEEITAQYESWARQDMD